jgi:hypothetical protein
VDIGRKLFRLALLGAVNHQVTHIMVKGSIFEDARKLCGSCHPKLGQLVNCHLCFGTWVGFLLALLFRPRFVDPARPPHAKAKPLRRVAGFFADAFAIALAGRLYTEALAFLAGQVKVEERKAELLEEQVERVQAGGVAARPRAEVRV